MLASAKLNENLKKVGCYITAVASALNSYGKKIQDQEINPGNLLSVLQEKKQINEDGLLLGGCIESFGFKLAADKTFVL